MRNERINNRDYLVFRAGELRLVVRRSGGVVELQARDRATALALHAISTGAISFDGSDGIELRIPLKNREAAFE